MAEEQSIWERTKSLLVFYVFSGHEEFQQFRASLDSALVDSNIKRLKVIIQVNDPKEGVLKHSLFSYISEKDIALFGNTLKKKSGIEGQESPELIRATNFDLFLSFGTPHKKILKWLTQVNATKKIGINTADHAFFDMILQCSIDSIDNSVNFTSNMLNKVI